MSMKLQDLHKNKMLKTGNAMKHAGTPDRFGKTAAAPDRKEQRKLDQAAGLVPFACKLPSALVAQLHTEAQTRETNMNELVATLITQGLASKTEKTEKPEKAEKVAKPAAAEKAAKADKASKTAKK
jgi:hypothetical protein